jgi:hypothetical protein
MLVPWLSLYNNSQDLYKYISKQRTREIKSSEWTEKKIPQQNKFCNTCLREDL